MIQLLIEVYYYRVYIGINNNIFCRYFSRIGSYGEINFIKVNYLISKVNIKEMFQMFGERNIDIWLLSKIVKFIKRLIVYIIFSSVRDAF